MNETQMTLLRDWDGRDATGWAASEKYDGCRAYWDGARLWTREGNVIPAPAWFTAGLPDCHLDGEIWAGRGKFAESVAAVQHGRFTASIKFMVFDAPKASGSWVERMATVSTTAHSEPVRHATIAESAHMRAMFQAVKAGGGEGLVLRDPRCRVYEYGRTNKSMRVKQ